MQSFDLCFRSRHFYSSQSVISVTSTWSHVLTVLKVQIGHYNWSSLVYRRVRGSVLEVGKQYFRDITAVESPDICVDKYAI